MTLRFSLLLFLIGPSFLARAGDRPDCFEFAEYLRSQSEYYRAITEYHRSMFESSDDRFHDVCRYRIGTCFLAGKQCSDAISLFQTLINDRDGIEDYLASLSHYRLAESYYCSGEFQEAAIETLAIERDSGAPAILLPAVYSGTISLLQNRDVTGALSLLDKHESIWPDAADHKELSRSISELRSVRFRKPGLAGMLSALLPGSGQIYAGRARDGLTAFVINALFIGGMLSAIDSGHQETAWILGFFELGWYSANIYNAMNDCHKSNRIQWSSHLDAITLRHGRPFPPIDDSSL